MTLRRYLSCNAITQADFACDLGVTQATISRYVRGERFPSPDTIKAIHRATDGNVSIADWYEAEAAQ